jgi:hypothetical protein
MRCEQAPAPEELEGRGYRISLPAREIQHNMTPEATARDLLFPTEWVFRFSIGLPCSRIVDWLPAANPPCNADRKLRYLVILRATIPITEDLVCSAFETAQENLRMSTPYADPVAPYPHWQRMIYHLPRPVTEEDVAAFVRNQDLYRRETDAGEIQIIHKFGIVEINCLIGERTIEVWFAPGKSAVAATYVDALLATRFP